MSDHMNETGDQPLTPEQANWLLVKNQIARMSEEQDRFFVEMRAARRVDSLLLIGRFDGIEARLDRLTKAVELQTDLIEALNGIVAGIRSASNSTYDMATSAARKIERVRRFLKVPDEIVQDVKDESLAAGGDSADAGDYPPRPFR